MSNYDFDAAKRFFAARLGFTTGPFELAHMIETKQDVVIIDTRYPSDFRNGRIPGAINLAKGMWHRTEQLRKDALHIVYCYNQQCHLAAEAAAALVAAGYAVMEMEGGFDTWVGFGQAVESDASVSAAS